jgi:hypothetical protein
MLQQPSAASCAKLNIFLPRIAAPSTTMSGQEAFSNRYKMSAARLVVQNQAGTAT